MHFGRDRFDTKLTAVIWSFSHRFFLSLIPSSPKMCAGLYGLDKGRGTHFLASIISKRRSNKMGFGHTFYSESMYNYCDLSTLSYLTLCKPLVKLLTNFVYLF